MEPAPLVAPDPHTHAHDVGALEAWMSDVTAATDKAFALARRKEASGRVNAVESAAQFNRIAEQLVEELYAKGKKLTVFHNELARQTAVHCPRVAK
jgi:hypothetical protein